jgi:DNA invertase Pin-like site-specific DNA recombinase
MGWSSSGLPGVGRLGLDGRTVVPPGETSPKTPIRCAIYTRKSTEEGLEQDFNSLDAQRECAEAYILSQRQAGWTLVSQRYDDGGFTGANLERPALRQLTADIEARRVDCVLVYKVDRLSRSLLDFARLMEVFDKCGVTFVSVTQQINSHSPMGRLTLNVLLSFAQFEREIISERTRDKQSAARRKGKWTGGFPVLGYDADPQTCRLVVNEAEAEQVKKIFTIFLRRGSLAATLEDTRRRGWTLKSWTTRKAKPHVGKLFDRPALIRLLTNVLYIGEVNHRGKVYPGEHNAIVDRTIWTKANDLLEGRSRGSEKVKRNRHGAILQGLLKCANCGSGMVPGYTTRGSRRYRYYICRKAQKQGAKACPGQMVAAERIELAVVAKLYERIAKEDWQDRPSAFPESRADWDVLQRDQQHALLEQAVDRILYDHRREQAGIQLRQSGTDSTHEEVFVRVRKKAWEQLSPPLAKGRAQVDRENRLPRVSRLMALASRLESLLYDRHVKDYADLARLGGVSRARITQIMNLRNLAPAIQEQLLFLSTEAGKKINETALRRIANETDWSRQTEMFEGLLIL